MLTARQAKKIARDYSLEGLLKLIEDTAIQKSMSLTLNPNPSKINENVINELRGLGYYVDISSNYYCHISWQGDIYE